MGLIRENVSGCFRIMQKLFPKSISLPAVNVQQDPVLSDITETGNLSNFEI
jgi:hypothetical protein